MNGRTLSDALARLLDENPPSSGSLDPKTSYDFLYEAACEFVRRTYSLRASQGIATVANQAEYDLGTDFFFLYWKDDWNRFIVKFNDGNADYYPTFREYEVIARSGNTTSTPVPSNFTVTDQSTPRSTISGTTTSAGSLTYGESSLVCSTANFTSSTISVGDEVQNRTDGSAGVILAITGATTLETALFDGNSNQWSSGDDYIIYPQPRKQIILDPAPSTSSMTITVKYVQKPIPPVFSEQRAYRIENVYAGALVKYAAWLYKYRQERPDYGDAWMKYFDYQVRQAAKDTQLAFGKTSFRINYNRRSYRDRSYR